MFETSQREAFFEVRFRPNPAGTAHNAPLVCWEGNPLISSPHFPTPLKNKRFFSVWVYPRIWLPGSGLVLSRPDLTRGLPVRLPLGLRGKGIIGLSLGFG